LYFSFRHSLNCCPPGCRVPIFCVNHAGGPPVGVPRHNRHVKFFCKTNRAVQPSDIDLPMTPCGSTQTPLAAPPAHAPPPSSANPFPSATPATVPGTSPCQSGSSASRPSSRVGISCLSGESPREVLGRSQNKNTHSTANSARAPRSANTLAFADSSLETT